MSRKNIAFIGAALDENFGEKIAWLSDVHLPGYDYIIVSALALYNELKTNLGNPTHPDTDNTVRQKINSRKDELREFYKLGGIVIMFIDIFPRLDYRSSNINRNIHLIDMFNSSDQQVEIQKAEGIDVLAVLAMDEIFSICNVRFYSFLDSPNGKPIIWTQKSKRSLTFHTGIEKGILICLPKFSTKEQTSQPTKDAVAQYLKELLYLPKKLMMPELDLSQAPEWLNQYLIGDEAEVIRYTDQLTKQRIELESAIAEKQATLNQYLKMKSILYLDGPALELEVQIFFDHMGIQTIAPEGSNVDLIIKHNDFVGVVEIKGVSGSAARKNARQVENWVTDYSLQNDDEDPKGILIINTFKNQALTDRPKISFPPDVVDYSTNRNHCLMLTLDLLNMRIDHEAGLVSKEQIIELIIGTAGILNYKPKLYQ